MVLEGFGAELSDFVLRGVWFKKGVVNQARDFGFCGRHRHSVIPAEE
jgi:hypothetical protein